MQEFGQATMEKLKRRHFVLMGVGAAGALGIAWLSSPVRARLTTAQSKPAAAGTHELNGWVTIGSDESVTVSLSKMEMGQGISTGVAMLLAEELDADWDQIRVRPAFDDPIYNNQAIAAQMANVLDPRHTGSVLRPIAEQILRKLARELPGLAVTGASSSIRDQWLPMRQAGASARQMLLQAASDHWHVPIQECRTSKGRVHHASGKTLSFGEIAEAASRIPVPTSPPLKSPAAFQVIGRPLRRLDAAAKSSGSATYGIDVLPDGLLYAAARMAPVLGGRVKQFDASRARDLGGIAFVEFAPQEGGLGSLGMSSGGVAVIAEKPYEALQAAEALTVNWELGDQALLSSAGILAQLRQAAGSPYSKVIFEQGAVDEHLRPEDTVVSAAYDVPFLAHSAMEPMNCTVLVSEEHVDVWIGCQGPSAVQEAVAKALHREAKTVRVHPQLMGGGFGRRTFTDCAVQAALIANAKPGRPVQFLWTREQDIAHDFYRAAFAAQCRATLDASGQVLAWDIRLAGTSLGQPALLDPAREGTVTMPYQPPHLRVSHAIRESGIPTGIWRSVAHSYNTFFVESFVDELALAAHTDPLAFRRRLLAANARLLHVLEIAERMAGWQSARPPSPDGMPQALGVALSECFGSVVAQVARISIGPNKKIRVHEVTCVVDCGIAINPSLIRQQMESGIVYGLTAALYGRIDVQSGEVRQSNFHDYPALRMDECPRITTHIVPSAEPPQGVGEVATPPIAPAVANAVFALTGQRLRSLPLTLA